jgi:hypothetical protein
MEFDKVPDKLKGFVDVGAFLPSQNLPNEGQELVDDVRGYVVSGRLVILGEDLPEEVAPEGVACQVRLGDPSSRM